MADIHLIVRVPFDGHEIGHRITDAEKIAAIHGGELAHLEAHCIRVAADAHGWAPTASEEAPQVTAVAEETKLTKVAEPVAAQSAGRIHAPSPDPR